MTEANLFWPSDSPDVIGDLKSRGDVREAVEGTLQRWVETYLQVTRDRRGLTVEDLRPVEDWTVLAEYRSLPTTSAAAMWTVCPGTLGRPIRQGDGTYLAHYAVQVSVLVYGTDWAPTDDLTALYSSAAMAALLQHPSLDGFAQTIDWVGSRYGEVEHSSTRTLGAEQINFDVAVPAVVSSFGGPAAPNNPGPLPPTVDEVDVTLIKEPL